MHGEDEDIDDDLDDDDCQDTNNNPASIGLDPESISDEAAGNEDGKNGKKSNHGRT